MFYEKNTPTVEASSASLCVAAVRWYRGSGMIKTKFFTTPTFFTRGQSPTLQRFVALGLPSWTHLRTRCWGVFTLQGTRRFASCAWPVVLRKLGNRQGYLASLFPRFVLILQYYVLENITVLVTKKCPYLWLASLFFLIFCSITILNKQNLIGIQTISISSWTFCDQVVTWKLYNLAAQTRNALSGIAGSVSWLLTLVRFLRKASFVAKVCYFIDSTNKQAKKRFPWRLQKGIQDARSCF